MTNSSEASLSCWPLRWIPTSISPRWCVNQQPRRQETQPPRRNPKRARKTARRSLRTAKAVRTETTVHPAVRRPTPCCWMQNRRRSLALQRPALPSPTLQRHQPRRPPKARPETRPEAARPPATRRASSHPWRAMSGVHRSASRAASRAVWAHSWLPGCESTPERVGCGVRANSPHCYHLELRSE